MSTLTLMAWASLQPALATDWHEPDDTQADAAAQPPLYHLIFEDPIALPPAVAERGGHDWYHAYADCCEQAGFLVRWEPRPGARVRFEIVDGAGARWSPTDPGVQVWQGPSWFAVAKDGHGGPLFLHVFNTGTRATSYQVRVLAPVYP